jgi:hypothetical protein
MAFTLTLRMTMMRKIKERFDGVAMKQNLTYYRFLICFLLDGHSWITKHIGLIIHTPTLP